MKIGWKWVAAWVVCCIVLVINAWSSLSSLVDDAFISGRYALLAESGFGYVYNAHTAPIEGFSNPLWTAWLSLTMKWGLPSHQTMVWSGVLCGMLALACLMWLTCRILETTDVRLAVLPALLLAIDPHFGVVISNGLESALYMAMVFGALAGVGMKANATRAAWGVWVGLLCACRPEGLLVMGLVLLFDVLPRPPRRMGSYLSVATAAVPVGLLWVWRLWNYGAWLPNTASAKATMAWADLMWKHWVYLRPDWYFWVGWLVLVGVAVWLGNRTWRVGGLLCLVLALVAVAGQVYLWMPGARLLLTPMALGFVLLAAPLLHARRGVRRSWAVVLCMAVALLFLSPVRGKILRQDWVHSVQPDNPALLAALHLREHAPPGTTLAIRDAGVVAFGAGAEMTVFELHPRALTQLHEEGADAKILEYTPVNPDIFVFTSNREKRQSLYYGPERALWNRTTAGYRYMGRVYQHHHRYYDVLVREELKIPSFPDEWITNRALRLSAHNPPVSP